MSWQIKIAQRVRKQLRRLPKKDGQHLLFILEDLSNSPYQGDIEKIAGEKNVWRRRIGNYRLLYDISSHQKLISVLDVQRRTTATYHKRRR